MVSKFSLDSLILTKNAHIGVIGLGYVGLPLAILFAQKGFTVTGLVRSQERKLEITHGKKYLADLGIQENLQAVLNSGSLQVELFTPQSIAPLNVLIVCVPTPVDERKNPDLTSIRQVSSILSSVDLTGKLIVNESTVAPGTTREYFGNFKGNYSLVCSPERVDPGNKEKEVAKIPKVIGGRDTVSTKFGSILYKSVLDNQVVTVSSLEAAEMSKMLENTYRAVNIALINEFALLADNLGIDVMEVIEAAKTKWSFQPHYPSIGVGGHCIPIDPYYILHLANEKGINFRVVHNGLKQNENMPGVFIEKFIKVYKKKMTVVVYGIAYKKNIKDMRESPAIAFCNLLKVKKIPFSVYDPYFNDQEIRKIGFSPAKKNAPDIFVVATDHDALKEDANIFIDTNTIVIDGRNFFQKKIGKLVIGIGRQFV